MGRPPSINFLDEETGEPTPIWRHDDNLVTIVFHTYGMKSPHEGVRELEIAAWISSDHMIGPHLSPFKQTVRGVAVLKASQPLLTELTAVERFRLSVLSAMRAGLESRLSPAQGLPFAGVRIEVCDDTDHLEPKPIQRISLFVEPDLDRKPGWRVCLSEQESKETRTGCADKEKALTLAGGLLTKIFAGWVSLVAFETPSDLPRTSGGKGSLQQRRAN